MPAHVTILMAVRDGAPYLPAQLRSIAAQSHRDWNLIVSDDGSRDGSRALIEAFARATGRVVTCEGPGLGAAENFLSLLRHAACRGAADDWLAFADQDDEWLPDRLARGLAALARQGERPALYCSRTWITDAALRPRQLSPRCGRPLGFRNALVQNVAAGNTILLNPPAARLICAAAREVPGVVMHDWWVYQLIAGCGGALIHDDSPTLLYRQHGRNAVGANSGLRARWWRMRHLLGGGYRRWMTINLAALHASSHRLSPENRALLATFAGLREQPLAARLRGLWQLGLYRQRRAGTAGLWVAALLRRI